MKSILIFRFAIILLSASIFAPFSYAYETQCSIQSLRGSSLKMGFAKEQICTDFDDSFRSQTGILADFEVTLFQESDEYGDPSFSFVVKVGEIEITGIGIESWSSDRPQFIINEIKGL